MKFDAIFRSKYHNWRELENSIKQLTTTKKKGDAFEQFVFAYFTYFKDIYQIAALYPGPEIPEDLKREYKLEKKDSGVDGIFIKDTGKSVSYQAKFRTDGTSVSYDELTSFWSESEHSDQRCIISNCHTLPKQAYKKKNQFLILRDTLNSLDSDFFTWLYDFAKSGTSSLQKTKFRPRKHQQKMIDDVIDGFNNENRGKMLAACATGKTLTALWIKENLHASAVLFVAPNLALIKQTLESWMPQADKPFTYMCVCSDQTVANNAYDGFHDDVSCIGIPVSTDTKKIAEFLEYPTSKDKIIFSTYQSLDAVSDAVSTVGDFSFDIAFFDEAHRTAGNKDSQMFVLGMNDEYIRCRKRLFMTATERFVNPHIIGRAKQLNYEVFSMDNPEQYGKTLTSLPFREAIDNGIINDYKIVVCCMNESELKTIIRENKIISTGNRNIDAQTLFKQVLLAKAIQDLGISKVISYHKNISEAKQFITPRDGTPLSDIIAALNDNMSCSDIYSGHINGKMNSDERAKILDAFVQSPCGIISNARCLTEGVDLPIIDAVYFSDPKNSLVDIIQAIGRSLRKESGKPGKVSYIIIPIIISDNVLKFEDIDPKEFSTLHSVIQALRDQDRILADYIDKINLRRAKGKGHISDENNSPIIVELSNQLDLDEFSDGLNLRIAEVNKDPDTISKEFIVNKTSRTSGIKRTFRTVGDYSVNAYYNNLVLPTLSKYPDLTIGLPRKSIMFNHNNISHCVKIGALDEKDGLFYVTDIGKAMFEYRNAYVDIFKEQMIKYYELDAITRIPRFPYRMAMRVIKELGYVTKFEFICSLYIGRHFGPSGEREAIERVKYLRKTYPNIEILNEVNKRIVLDSINKEFNTTLKFEDIWTNQTTVYNQYNYILKHFFYWDDIFDTRPAQKEIRLLKDGAKLIDELLDKSFEIEKCPLDSIRQVYTRYNGY